MTSTTQENQNRINSRFMEFCGKNIDELLQPIDPGNPSGEFLKGNGVYSAIKTARKADDPNLPMGDWQHNLKVADWDEVIQIAVNALSTKTKDLQIGIWLLEAQIYKHGFSGIAPAVMLITEMSAKFWDDLHPQINDGDIEYRTNLVAWLNDKLQPAIRQLPITNTRDDRQYSWSDWEMAWQLEQLAERDNSAKKDYVSSQQIVHAISVTAIEFYRDLYLDISEAIVTLQQLSDLLDERCREYAPTISGLSNLLLEIRDTLASHVKHRGLTASGKQEDEDTASVSPDEPGGMPPPGGNNGPVSNREKAYSQLAEAAEFLIREDPHSPVPYLVFKAIEWGNLNTAELYQELFVQYQGQLNIFEILGLEIKK